MAVKKVLVFFLLICVFFCVEPKSSVQAEEQIKIGGLAGFIFYDQNKDKTGKDLHPYYDFHPVYLYTNVTLSDRISSLLEIEYEHSPKFEAGASGAGEIKLERGYIEANISDGINFQFGKFFTNFGPWYEEHWRIITPTFERTIAFENAYVPNFQMGVKLFGHGHLFDSLNLKYYVWNSMGNEVYGTNSRKGGKFDAFGTELDGYYKDYHLGVAAYTQTNPSKKNRNEKHYNIFSTATILKKVVLKSEYTLANFANGEDGTQYTDANTFYAGVEYNFLETWSVYYRFEQGHDQKRTGLTGPSSKTQVNAFALTWSPVPGFRLKSEFSEFNFKENSLVNYNKIIISSGVIF